VFFVIRKGFSRGDLSFENDLSNLTLCNFHVQKCTSRKHTDVEIIAFPLIL
jgi:hypothetical protein